MRALTIISTAALAMAAMAENWSLSVINSHFMGNNSGIANGTWPPGTEFNSTVNFVLQRVPGDLGTAYTAVGCATNWKEPDYPKSWMACNDTGTRWRFATEQSFTAGNFTLEILRAEIGNPAAATEQNATAYIGFASVHISSDNKTDSSSFLTCLDGAPFTGINCSTSGVDGIEDGLGAPIPLTPSFTYYQLESLLLPEVELITPGVTNSTNCNRTIEFNVTSIMDVVTLATCSNYLSCDPWPIDTDPFACTSPVDTYTWWWRTFQNEAPPSTPGSQLYVQHTYCLITDFTTVDGVPIAVNAQATGWSLANVGAQLIDEGCTGGTCVTGTPPGAMTMILIDEFGVAADAGCVLPHGN